MNVYVNGYAIKWYEQLEQKKATTMAIGPYFELKRKITLKQFHLPDLKQVKNMFVESEKFKITL